MLKIFVDDLIPWRTGRMPFAPTGSFDGMGTIWEIFFLFSMTFDIYNHRRRSIRLKNYDYSSAGLYFITICTYQRQYLFGEIHNGIMTLNPLGQLVAQEWERSAQIRQEIILGNWIVMPNHFHAIVQIDPPTAPFTDPPVGVNGIDPARQGFTHPPTNPHPHMKPRSLSSLITGFKSTLTRQNPSHPIWQRNYHDHIIRDRKAYENITHYITNNPKKWTNDRFR